MAVMAAAWKACTKLLFAEKKFGPGETRGLAVLRAFLRGAGKKRVFLDGILMVRLW